MPITSGLVRIDVRYRFLGQACETVQYYLPGGAAWLTATGAAGAEAYWNNVKDRWRAMVPASSDAQFESVLLTEIGGSESFGEFAVPLAERDGTRSAAGLGDFLPAYVAVGCRLTVATRTTRPGQKRIPFALEGDNVNGRVQSAFNTLCNALADIWSTNLVLGAPVLLGTLIPQVVHFPTVSDPGQRQQDVIGFVLNGQFTSQVSRRPGHGS